ncbi:MAG: ABC transporter ATP-binding protein [Chloroflexi bacterium]|nr:ABC transporter ATP-binding protein [Chloroflexota bacterium]MDA1147230.1 ABC transporter ATP-binding protein [Chloroflexota bacterium]
MGMMGGGGRRTRDGRPEGPKRSILFRAAGRFRPYRWHSLALVVLVSLTVGLSLFSLTVLAGLVGEMTKPDGSKSNLTRLFLTYGGLIALGGFLGVAESYVNQLIGQGVMHRLRTDLHDHLQRVSVRFYTSNRTGEILSRVGTDVNAVQGSVTGTFTEFLTNILTLVIAFGIMLSIEWRLAIATLVILPLWVLPTVRVGLVMRRLMREWHDEMGEMTAHLEETLSVSGSMLVKSFGRVDHERERFARSNDSLQSLSIRRMMAGRWFNMGTGLFGAIIPGIAYWYLGGKVLDGGIGVTEVVAFAMLAQRVFGPFASIARINTTLLSSLALFERIFEYLDLPVEVEEKDDAQTLEHPRGALAFDAVTFGYVPGRNALGDVTFEAAPGSMLALVGPSGAGKTTVTYLIQRFYDPVSGAIRLDGHDLRDLTLDSVSRTVGAVMQDTYLFHSSLMENIRYGRLDATDTEVRAAADAAGLEEMIDRLSDGLDTVVGERGYRLSGGEKQRVAIARAILKDPPVLILDEATASLDSRLERVIREAMEQLAAGRTTVVIAHRLSTVLKADQILVLDQGRVVERGRHEELLALGGLYASLYREQFEDATRAAAEAEAAGVTGGD